ncbi:MAG: Rrf2 family transcriptional regulator [Myxococcota bacterium]
MKLYKKCMYGIRAVFDVEFHGKGRPARISEIAERQSIPPRFLEQIFQDLKRAGIVVSKRGPRGGYVLGRPAHAVSLRDIVYAVEGPLGIGDPDESVDCERTSSRAITKMILAELSKRVEECLSEVSIQSICDRGNGTSHGPKGIPGYAYTI